MNFFDGAIRVIDGRLAFVEGKLDHARPLSGNKALAADAGKSDEPVVMTGELTFPAGGFTLGMDHLPPAVKQRLSDRVGSHVVLGVRPEHLHLRE